MRVFVGYSYHERDNWIEAQVYPILRCLDFVVVDGKYMQGEVLQPQVKARIDQSDAAIGFLTIREGQGDAEFNSHIWVHEELVYANSQGKSIIVVKEDGARVPEGLLGNRQYIPLRQNDRLACVVELVTALGRRNIRRLRLEPEDDLRRKVRECCRNPRFTIRYRTRDENDFESPFRPGRLEIFDQGLYLNVSDVPKRGYVEVEGVINEEQQFTSDWVTADVAVQVKIS
jgi:hypothetical protein